MPGPLSHPGAVALDGKIYVVGGFLRNVHLDAQDAVFEYDVAADRWRTLPKLASPRGSVGVAALNGKIHAIGGRDVNRVTLALHDVFDPKVGKWSPLAPLPRARDHAAVIAVDGRIHVIGGRFDTPAENTALHDVYDPATNAWTPAAPLPAPRSGGAVVLYRDFILVTGGECDTDKPFVAERGLRCEDRPLVGADAHVFGTSRNPGSGCRTGALCPGRRASVPHRRLGHPAHLPVAVRLRP